jgi:hypothetical protein
MDTPRRLGSAASLVEGEHMSDQESATPEGQEARLKGSKSYDSDEVQDMVDVPEMTGEQQ